MIISEQTTAILFKFLNFGLLVGVGIYFFKKYLYLGIRQQIAQKKKAVEDLKQERDALARRYDDCLTLLQGEQEEMILLQERVVQWSFMVKQKDIMRDNEKKDRTRILQERAQQRMEHDRLQVTFQQVMPTALDLAQKKIRERYDKVGNEYLKSILAYMQEIES